MKLSIPRMVLGISAAFAPAAANASIQINIRQDPGQVIAFTLGGDIGVFGLFDAGTATLTPGVTASDAYLGLGGGGTFHGYNGFSGPGEFGVGSLVAPTSTSGTPFAISGYYSGVPSPVLWLPEGFSSGPINATATWVGQSFSSLGLTPGFYRFPAGHDSDFIDVDIYTRYSVLGVPEPATWR